MQLYSMISYIKTESFFQITEKAIKCPIGKMGPSMPALLIWVKMIYL
jgi:hypothetical protein